MSNRFKPGDRVIHITASAIPEGVKGIVLGRCQHPEKTHLWEVEYDNYPNPYSYLGYHRSATSWISRDTSIELTREQAILRNQKG